MLAIVAFAGTVWASQSGDASNGLTIGTSTNTYTVKGSKGVTVTYDGAAQGYVLGSYHTSGTQTFGSSSGDTKIFKSDGTNATLPSTIPTGSESATWGSGWAAM